MNVPRYRLPAVGAPVLPVNPIPGPSPTGRTRVLVTGSRAWVDEAAVRTALTRAWRDAGQPLTVVHGGCPAGADAIAAAWVREHELCGITQEVHAADWRRVGRWAGPARNAAMVAAGADLTLAFPLGESRGTRHTMQLARDAGIPVHEHHPEEAR